MHANLVKPLVFLFDPSQLILPIFSFATYLQCPQSAGSLNQECETKYHRLCSLLVWEFALGFPALFHFGFFSLRVWILFLILWHSNPFFSPLATQEQHVRHPHQRETHSLGADDGCSCYFYFDLIMPWSNKLLLVILFTKLWQSIFCTAAIFCRY